MNETHEPSYYEIALTNRQVMVVFVVLLLSVVAAFLSGVWVGRDRSMDGVVVADRGTGVPTDAEEDEEGEIRSLNFFTDGKDTPEEAPLRPVAEEPQPGTTLLEDVAKKSRGTAPPIVEEPPVEPKRAETRPAPVEAPAAVEKPREQPERMTPPQPARTASAEPPPAAGFVVQVFSSGEEAQAARVRDKLQSSGYSAFLSPVVVDSSTMYRVRVGPFGARAEAETAASRVKRDFKYDTWITR